MSPAHRLEVKGEVLPTYSFLMHSWRRQAQGLPGDPEEGRSSSDEPGWVLSPGGEGVRSFSLSFTEALAIQYGQKTLTETPWERGQLLSLCFKDQVTDKIFGRWGVLMGQRGSLKAQDTWRCGT